jgi:hypothetical protein
MKKNGAGVEVPIFELWLGDEKRHIPEFWGNLAWEGIKVGFVYLEPSNGGTPSVEPDRGQYSNN